MRTEIKKIASMFIIGLLLAVTHTQAQNERRRNNYQDNNNQWSSNHQDQHNYTTNYNQRNSDNDYNRYSNTCNQSSNGQAEYRYYGYYDRNNNCYSNYGRPAWMSHRRMHPRARYIYFRDADVYFDCNRNTYITISGRTWSISTTLPQHMCRVDMSRAAYEDVDYNGDNVYQYHSQRYYTTR